MGQDCDVVQEEYELEISTDSDDGDFSEEEQLVLEDADSFVVKPRGTTGVLRRPRGGRRRRWRLRVESGWERIVTSSKKSMSWSSRPTLMMVTFLRRKSWSQGTLTHSW
jgi:hypothetical protein